MQLAPDALEIVGKDALKGKVMTPASRFTSLPLPNLARPTPSCQMSRQWHLFLISLLVRSLSLLSQTFFQPDEFYQSLEPAHHLVFGYGYLTWEWRDLPVMATKNGDDLIQRALSGLGAGRLRGWSWPGCFALVYWVLKRSGLDGTTWIVSASADRMKVRIL